MINADPLLADQLRQAVRACGLTQTAIAALAGMYPANLSRFLAGRSIELDTAERLALAIGRPLGLAPKAEEKRGGA